MSLPVDAPATTLPQHRSHPVTGDRIPIRSVIFTLLGLQNVLNLVAALAEPYGGGRRRDGLTPSGGFKPHFFALFHRSSLVMPAQGPYLEVKSNTLSMSAR